MTPWLVCIWAGGYGRRQEAVNARDTDAIMATFADDALVNDARREFWGKDAIRRFVEKEIVGDRITMDVREVVYHHGDTIVRAASSCRTTSASATAGSSASSRSTIGQRSTEASPQSVRGARRHPPGLLPPRGTRTHLLSVRHLGGLRDRADVVGVVVVIGE
jgi:ketosteroid isomerase-like protein